MVKRFKTVLYAFFGFGIAGIGLSIVLGSTRAQAQFSAYGLNFDAPQVTGKANVSNPAIGEIVYDANDNNFWGWTAASAWVQLNAPAGSVTPSGTISAFGGTTAPTGYLMCDGSAVSRTTYATLFAAIGTAYGSGDGSTTFNLPDLRGRFLRGVDGTAGNDPDSSTRTAINSGGNTGNNVGSLEADAYKSHTHTLTTYAGTTYGSGYVSGNGPTNSGSATTSAAGGNETRPKNVYVNFIIKY